MRWPSFFAATLPLPNRRWLLSGMICAVLASCTQPVPRNPDERAIARGAASRSPAVGPPRGQDAGPTTAVDAFGVWPATPAGRSGFSVRYASSLNPFHAQLRATLARDRVFERVASGLNRWVRLPVPIQIQTADCSMISAFYDARTRRITLCYELLDYFAQGFRPTVRTERELREAVIGATLFTFFHEAGHGLIHLLDLPAVGREEDSADQLATLTLLSMGDRGVAMALAGARWFQLQAAHGGHATPFWDEHALDAQRFYNVMCMIYGSNPARYASFASSGDLPFTRAGRCQEDYLKISRAWDRLLGPYVATRPR